MRLVFIYGLPAAGKLTVAQELAVMTGYKLFHNHLAVDLLLSVFEFGSEPFVEMREEIWLRVFDWAGRSGLEGLIFTFAPEATVRPEFIAAAVSAVENGGGSVNFVELACPFSELERRIDSPSRRSYGKLTSVALLQQLHREGRLGDSYMPEPELSIDTSLCEPAEAAMRIAQELGLPMRM